jgi:hypothetical protein
VPRTAPCIARYAISVFNVEDVRCLTGDVPSQHSMRPVHSTSRRGDGSTFTASSLCSSSRRRPGHPTGSVPIQSDSGHTPIPPRTRRGHHDLYVAKETSAASQCYGDLGCQGARRLLQQRIFVAPSAISIMSLGPHVGAQHLCACPPSAIKGEACGVTEEIQS